MNTIELRKIIKNYIDEADERLLKIINAIIETDIEEHGLSQADKKILDQRLKFHRENPSDGKTWEEVREILESKYDL